MTSQTLDIDLIRPQFEDYRNEADTIVADASAVKIIDTETLSLAVSIGGSAKKVAKRIEFQRKSIVLEPTEFVKAVNGLCRQITDRLDDADRIAKGKIIHYQARIEMERREQERRAMEAARRLQEQLRREAEEANQEALREARAMAEVEMRKKRLLDEEEAIKRKATETEMAALAKKAEEERLVVIKQAEEDAAKMAIEAPTVILPIISRDRGVIRTDSGTAAHQRKVWTFEIVNEAEVEEQFKSIDEQKIRDAIRMGLREARGLLIFEKETTVFRT